MAITKLPNSLNYIGMLYNSDPKKTAFLQIIGGPGKAYTTNPEFPTSVDYTIGSASQPEISEDASMGALTPITYTKTQRKNVTQIFQEGVTISRRRKSAPGRLAGIHTSGKVAEEPNEAAFQLNRALEKTARDLNYTLINGTYSVAGLADSSLIDKTRGMLEAITTNVVAAGTAALTKVHLDTMFKGIFDNGPATLDGALLFCNSTKKQQITALYAVAQLNDVDRSRFTAGVNITKIVTDFGDVFVVVDNDMIDTAVMCITLHDNAGIQIVRPVHARLENGDYLLIKQLDQTGGDAWEIYHESGLDHGPEFYHGKVTGLTA